MLSSLRLPGSKDQTCSCSNNNGDFVRLEDKTFPRNLKGTEKGLEIYGFGIVEYYVRSESGRMLALRYLSGAQCSRPWRLPRRSCQRHPFGRACTGESWRGSVACVHTADRRWRSLPARRSRPGPGSLRAFGPPART